MIINISNYALRSIPLSFLLLFYSASVAQQDEGRWVNMEPKEMAGPQTQNMKELLSLSADLLAKVESLTLEYAEKMGKERESSDGNRQAMRTKMMDMMEEKDVKLKKYSLPNNGQSLRLTEKKECKSNAGEEEYRY